MTVLTGQMLQFADEVALVVPTVGACLEEAVAEVLVAGVGIGQQVPDDREDRVADGDYRASLALAPGNAVVPLAEKVSVLAAAATISPRVAAS